MMSFILEALKKSERERQQQGSAKSSVKQRSLSLSTDRPAQRWPFLIIGFVIVLLLLVAGAWLLFYSKSPTPESVSLQEQQPAVNVAPAPTSTPPVSSVGEPTPAPAVEPAPVPRSMTSTRVEESPVPAAVPAKEKEPASSDLAKSKNNTTETSSGVIPVQEFESAKPQPAGDYPLYEELSRELRNRMPKLDMSMHFFTETASRRLVRINGRLMHEGDWVTQDLQLLEITSTGVILDYLGKEFELSNLRK